VPIYENAPDARRWLGEDAEALVDFVSGVPPALAAVLLDRLSPAFSSAGISSRYRATALWA
jgi:hypothetical protein